MMKFIKPKQANAKAFIIWPLAAFQRNTSGNLNTGGGKFTAILDQIIIGKANHHTWRLKPFGRDDPSR